MKMNEKCLKNSRKNLYYYCYYRVLSQTNCDSAITILKKKKNVQKDLKKKKECAERFGKKMCSNLEIC